MNWKDYNPGNALNPYDNIGLNHNLLIEYFLQNVDKISVGSDKKLTIISDTISLVLPKAIELSEIRPDNQSKNLAYGAYAAAIIESFDKENLFFQIDDFSKEFWNLWEQLNNTITKLNIENVNDVLIELKEIDNHLISSDLSDSEKKIILQVNSIARYSSAYWVSEKNNPQSKWISISLERCGDFTRKAPPSWVYSDIKGAYIGAWFTANPFVALGSGAVSSLVDALIDFPWLKTVSLDINQVL